MRVATACVIAGLIGLVGLKAEGADDAISRLMHAQEEPAKNLPVAPAKPVPRTGAGPSVGTMP